MATGYGHDVKANTKALLSKEPKAPMHCSLPPITLSLGLKALQFGIVHLYPVS